MIRINQLSKKYNDKYVVKNASTLFPLGKVTSIIGPNGAGKSTLLSMASRLTDSDNGSVFIAGKNLSEWDSQALAKKLSVLSQSNNINMRFTVKELVAFGRFPHSQGRLNDDDQDIIERAMSHLGIQTIQDKYIDQLSGGQRQMAFIAMVVAQNTDYIFLDEPLNNLDIKHSVDIMSTLRSLAEKQNKAIVIVIHDINFASAYSDHIVAMKKGEVIINGDVEKVIDEDVLENIYELPFTVQQINGNRVALYYR
ncbi:iron ABC transporter ATP-binding protein [Psychromonas sp. PT13]|uniref:iron ABC transporter ATP-binding protein n=1 Tax=Psychromonas sp. PT13 TaxID=3439547 RepID=UPI003EBD74E1